MKISDFFVYLKILITNTLNFLQIIYFMDEKLEVLKISLIQFTSENYSNIKQKMIELSRRA